MKKLLSFFAVVAITGTAYAQQASGKVSLTDFHFVIKEGANSINVKDGCTIKLVKRAGRFTDIVYVDRSGNRTTLVPSRPGTGGAPLPSCPNPLPDACFGSTGGENIGLCICRPADLSNGNNTSYLVSLRVPAVQSIRTPAH